MHSKASCKWSHWCITHFGFNWHTTLRRAPLIIWFRTLLSQTTSTTWRYLSKISCTQVVEYSWLCIGRAATKDHVFHFITFLSFSVTICNRLWSEKVCIALQQLEMCPFSTTDWQFLRCSGESLCFCFLLSCARVSVNTLLNSGAAQLQALSALYLNKLPVNAPHRRICACALAGPDTILLWQSGKRSQRTACLVLSDGKIKTNPNRIHSPQLWVGRWWDHQRGTARSNMSSDRIIIDLPPALLHRLSMPSWVWPALSVTFLMPHCCLSSHECDMESWWLHQNNILRLRSTERCPLGRPFLFCSQWEDIRTWDCSSW